MSEVQKVVLLPRYSSLVGSGEFRGSPVNVRDYSKAELTAWRGVLGGTAPAFDITLEESIDLNTWTPVTGVTLVPLQDAEDTQSCELELPWIRTVVRIVSSTPGSVTCWLVGQFTRRDA